MLALFIVFFTFFYVVPPIYSSAENSYEVLKPNVFPLTLNLEAKPAVTNFNWTRNGMLIIENVSNSSIIISTSNSNCGDVGLYMVTANNSVGMGSFNFTLTVNCKLCYYFTIVIILHHLVLPV